MKYLKYLFGLLLLFGCVRPDPEVTIVTPAAVPPALLTAQAERGEPIDVDEALTVVNLPLDLPPDYVGTPTPDPPRIVPTYEAGSLLHTVSAGETLGYIAQLYQIGLDDLQEANGLENRDLLSVGQQLAIPREGSPQYISPAFKVIPDSELVYGPAAQEFDVRQVAAAYGGYLLEYGETIEGEWLAGPEVVSLVAHRFSVNPRLLLAVLEHRSGWVTRPAGVETPYPLGVAQANLQGLYRQLSWTADRLNFGFYGRSEGGLIAFTLGDGQRFAFDPTINDGTAGVQVMLGAHNGAGYQQWLQDVGPNGLFATYSRLFGNPFAYSVDPLWPNNLQQPSMQLPWASGEAWYFTGGPHGGWAAGSSWAALDFVPPGGQLGCVQSDAWVRAMADGIVTRSDFGAVVVELSGDGYAGTGWAITYMHVEKRDRVPVGTQVRTGDMLGHPSCEGGFSTGTHLHIARTYNGRWVSADGAIPFAMSGWVSEGTGREYNGRLLRDGVVREACQCREEINRIDH
ncbi:MAG: LysM peptidoglycan-binding domain-containing protein [Chloroflexota bacterium]